MTELIIAGFPKSGNTWLTRLLSDALDYPVTGVDDAVPLAADEQVRNGDGLIRQLHLVPFKCAAPRFIESRYYLNPSRHNGEKVIHLYRDPRDVAVSVNAYWGIGDLTKALTDVVYTGSWPLWGTGWPEWMQRWNETDLPHATTCYELLHADPAAEIQRLCAELGLASVKPLAEVVERNELETYRAYIAGSRDGKFPHGKGAQLANLRHGHVGDWRNLFTLEQKRAAARLFNEYLLALDYETSPLWWCDLQERNEQSLERMLGILFDMTDTGIELCRTLYRLAEQAEGDVIEVGAGRGRTAIALGWRTGDHVISVDNYADNRDWANNVYGEAARRDYLANTRKAGVAATLRLQDVRLAAQAQQNPIGLWLWDISARGRLLQDWQAWRDQIRGRALIRDTFDQSLGSREVIDYEAERGEFEIECDEPGMLILRRR